MALKGNVALLAGLMGGDDPQLSAAVRPSPLAQNIEAGLNLIHLRQDRDHFSDAEGVLRGDDACLLPCDSVSTEPAHLQRNRVGAIRFVSVPLLHGGGC